jgi:hypothetical protein
VKKKPRKKESALFFYTARPPRPRTPPPARPPRPRTPPHAPLGLYENVPVILVFLLMVAAKSAVRL